MTEYPEDDIDIVKNEISPNDDDLQISVLLEKARRLEEAAEARMERRLTTRHKCVLGSVNEININTELCTRDNPAILNYDKMCLHYVIHYIKRNYWQSLVPELTEVDKARIEAYQCNVCGKKFRNNHTKQEYPGRGSFICHWATEHGKLVEAMRSDKEVDMTQVLEVFREHDERIGGFIRNGTKTSHDSNPVKVIESLTWRIQQQAQRNASGETPSMSRSVKKVIKCPKCPKYDRNKDPDNLKLHIFHHYMDFWKTKIPVIEGNETFCDQCSPVKKIVGANPEGCRTSLVCHRALQHDELRPALETDPSLPSSFFEALFGETSSKKPMTVLKVKPAIEDNSEAVDDPAPNVNQEKERIAQEVRSRELMESRRLREKEEKASKKRKADHEKMLELEKRLDQKLKKNKGI